MSEKLSAPRGTADSFPPESDRWNALEERIHTLADHYGYGEIRTPLFESTELFVRGVGEQTDIVEKEMYTFTDRGGRSLTLRPEWTAPVVRAALEHHLFAAGPLRLYYIGPIFRYERPQKGRYRQSHQFGVECFGFAGAEADLEVISLAWELVQSYGISDAALNLNSLGDDRCRPFYREALLEHFRPHLAEMSEGARERSKRNPLRLLDSKDPADVPFIESAPGLESFLCRDCREHFHTLTSYLDLAKIPFVLNPRIVRGIDYYDRTVFEITSSVLGAQSSVCGGGRYDGLVASLGGPDVPAVGFALGMERFLMMLEARGEFDAAVRRGIQAVPLGAQARTILVPIVAEMRRRLLEPTFADYQDRKLLAHLKIADRNGARYALIVGSEELASGELVLRDLERRSDRRLPIGEPRVVVQLLVEAGLLMDERYAEETQTLRELLAIMHEHDLDTIKVKLGDAIYELSRRQSEAAQFRDSPATSPPLSAQEQSVTTGDVNVTKMLAPLTGVFYRSPSPDAPPYVEVGDRVAIGDVLCVLEAMKLFNEIQSDDAGKIVRIVPGNGELVSQGEELFWIEP